MLLGPFVIAAGGTGGHLFPAEALAEKLMCRGAHVVLMTDTRSKAETSSIFGQSERFVIPSAGIAGRGLIRAGFGMLQISRGLIKARLILGRIAPRAVIGFGGYPSVAPVLAACVMRQRPLIVLHDQNAVLGRANRVLAKCADRLALSFSEVAGVPRGSVTCVTGNPVRSTIAARRSARFSVPVGRVRLLVLGGSLGARVLATLVPDALSKLPQELRQHVELTMQCPADLTEGVRRQLVEIGVRGDVAPFFQDVDARLEAAHLVVARAGGSTVAEIAVIGRPALFVPLAINPDQCANADVLVRAGGAIRLDEVGLTADRLARELQNLLTDRERLRTMAAAAATCGIADGADRLAALVLDAVSERTAS